MNPYSKKGSPYSKKGLPYSSQTKQTTEAVFDTIVFDQMVFDGLEEIEGYLKKDSPCKILSILQVDVIPNLLNMMDIRL